MPENTERDEAIVSAYEAGETLTQLARRFGLTKQRIAQIVEPFRRDDDALRMSDTEILDWLNARVQTPWATLHDLVGIPITSWPRDVSTLDFREAVRTLATMEARAATQETRSHA
jgi:hypothetical protein